MKTVVLYSSRTGNTKKVAEAIASVLPAGTPCLPVGEAPADLEEYDCVFLGFWVDRGTVNEEAKNVLSGLQNKHVAVFATLGAPPDSVHALSALDNAAALLPSGKAPAGRFICQGAVDPKLIEMMYQKFPAGSPHGKSPERDAMHAEAAKHPNEEDFAKAKAFAAEVLKGVAEA